MAVSLLLGLILHQALAAAAVDLRPGVGRQFEIIPGSTLTLTVGDLVPGRSYEARVSHSAVYPAEFHVEIVPIGRRLLDVDKAIFVAGVETAALKITTRFHGVGPDPDLGRRPIPFDLIVVDLRLGIVPADIIGLIAFVIVLVAAVLLFVVPRVHDFYFRVAAKDLHRS